MVTLLLTPPDAQKLELAKNQGKVSLSLRNPLDSISTADGSPITTEVLDPNVNARTAMARRRVGRPRGAPDPNVWQELNGEKRPSEEKKKEPEKPRAIVDVYRGDKHVQELFK